MPRRKREREDEEEKSKTYRVFVNDGVLDWSHWEAFLLPKDIALYQPVRAFQNKVYINVHTVVLTHRPHSEMDDFKRKYFTGFYLWTRTLDRVFEKGNLNEPGLWVLILSFLLDMDVKDIKFD